MSATLTLIASLFVFPADTDKASLEALAAASGRPRECLTRGKKRSKRPTVWQRAREPELVPYCDLVAQAHILLGSETPIDAQLALETAVKASTVWPNHAGSLLAEGRAAAVETEIARIWTGDVGHRVNYAAQHLHGGAGVDRGNAL